MKMEYNVQIIRGWPYDGALDRSEPIKSGVTLSNGDWVEKQSDNTVDKTSATLTNRAGLVVRGNGDSGSAAYTGKAVVLWSGFIAEVKNYDTSGTYAPGTNLTVKSGKLINAGGSDPVIGYVLDVIAASSSNDASLVVVIK